MWVCQLFGVANFQSPVGAGITLFPRTRPMKHTLKVIRLLFCLRVERVCLPSIALHTLATTQVDQRYENELSRLGVRQKLLFHVEHANPHVDRPLVRRITEAVESEIQAATSTGAKDQVVGIPRTEVDKAIHSHYDERKKTTTLYTLYLVHPGVRSRYRYIHDTSASAAVPPGDKGSAAKPTLPDGCSYVGWVGEHDRYVWLDLRAHVSSGWGPRSRSSGIVSPFTFPDMSTAATSSWKAESYGWLYSQLSALALRTATQLMAPPVVFAPAGLRENFQPWSPRSSTNSWATYDTEEHGSEAREAVAVKLFMVCDPAPCAQEEIHMWGELEELLQNVGARSDASMFFPTVTLSVAEVNLMQWPLLAVGLQQAVRTGPRRPTLASHELRHWLRQFIDTKAIQNEEDRREGTEFAGNRDHRSDGRSSTRTIPLFVINVDTDTPILLEHSMRSTVFPDMVISVSATGTGTSPVDSGFQCAGYNVSFPGHADGGSRSLLRETVASLAQAIYGAPPRTLSWNTLTDSLGTDYLWATGASLHTPLSSHASLTFPERDAYVRTRVLAKVDAAIRAARVVLEQAAAVEPVLANALSAGDNAVAVRHWTGVKRELENCLQELVMHHEKSAIDHALKFEAHVGGLGRALSQGYGSGVHVSSCSCGQADGGGGFGGVGGEVRWRVFGISKGFTDALFAAAAFCAALAMLCKCARRPKTKRS